MISVAGRLILVSAVLVGLSGCGTPGLPTPDDAPGDSVPGDNAPGDTAAGDESPPAGDGGDDPLTLEQCMAEEWLLNNETWQSMLQPLAAESGATIDSVTGQFVLDLKSDNSYTATYTGWTVTTLQTGGVAVIERNGTDAGLWFLSGDTAGLSENTQGSSIVGYIDAGGQRIDLPSVGSAESGSLETFDVLCSPDDLIVTLDTGTVFFTLNP